MARLNASYEVRERPKVTIALSPVADAFIWDAEPTLNYGDTSDLIVGRTDSRLTRSLLLFDPSALRAGLDIISATIQLSARIVSNTAQEVEAHSLLGAWEELGVTWANQPGRNAVAEDQSAVATTPVELDVTSLFLGWYQQTRANNGIVIISSNEQAVEHAVFAAREWPQASRRPQLLVTYYAPDALTGVGDLPSTGNVIGYAAADLSSSGSVGGSWNDFTSVGRISRSNIIAIGTVFQVSSLSSAGIVRGARTADDFPGYGAVTRPSIFSQGSPRVTGLSDFPGAGYVLEHYDLTSTGSPRLTYFDDLPADGYVSNAANELASQGVVDGYYNDLPGAGSVRMVDEYDLPGAGYVAGAANELLSAGHVTGPWFYASGIVRQVSDLYAKGKVGVVLDLLATGIIAFTAASDLDSAGWPRIRDVAEILSAGYVRGAQTDLPSKGHVGAWVLEAKTTIRAWPPEGRSTQPA